MGTKKCTKCGVRYPETEEFFGHTPSGNLKGECRECGRKRSRAYERDNKDKRAIRDQRRAASGENARVGFDDDTKRHLLRLQKGVCYCCFQRIETIASSEVDHLVPLSQGGAHDASNLALAHAACNKEKHNKTLGDHWLWRKNVGRDRVYLGELHGVRANLESLRSYNPPWPFP